MGRCGRRQGGLLITHCWEQGGARTSGQLHTTHDDCLVGGALVVRSVVERGEPPKEEELLMEGLLPEEEASPPPAPLCCAVAGCLRSALLSARGWLLVLMMREKNKCPGARAGAAATACRFLSYLEETKSWGSECRTIVSYRFRGCRS